MGVNLTKGNNVSLTKLAPTTTSYKIGLGWDARKTDGATFDLDGAAFLLGANDKVRTDKDFIFYNEKRSLCGGVEHKGDNRTGVGEGDDEVVVVDTAKTAADINKVVFSVTIHEAKERKQTFGMVNQAYIRVLDATTNVELARYDLSEDASVEASMVFGELYRYNGEWKFRAVGQGFAGGLESLAKSYGVEV
jgi:tellurium resistance protein TerD